MTSEILWRWQAGTITYDRTMAVDIADDGTVLLAGHTFGNWTGTNAGSYDFAAVKLSADGVEEWRWQDGTEVTDYISDVAIGEDGSAILIGYSSGDWEGSNAGDTDFTATKISSNGTILWRWQDGTSSGEYQPLGAVRSDGSVFIVGFTFGNWSGEDIGWKDFAAVMLDADGDELWRWMNGTTSSDVANGVVIAEDDSVIICGYTYGNFGGLNAGGTDMVVIKLSSGGDFLWAWQDGTIFSDVVSDCTLGSDGSIYLTGYTSGNWSGINFGSGDFAAAKLDADGDLIWRWQDGTPESDRMYAAAVTADGSLFLAGYTYGNWGSTTAGSADFAIVQLHPNSTVLWRWQDGNSEYNGIVAAASSAGRVVFAATVYGDWEELSAGSSDFGAIMLESTGSDNNSNPTTSPAYSPSDSPILTQAPSPAPSSTPIPGPSPAPASGPIPTPLPSVSPVTVPPAQASTKTPVPSGSGNTGPSSLSRSSPSPSSASSSNVNIAIVSGVLGAVIGVVIAGLVAVLLGRRHARRSTPIAESAPRPPPPNYHAAVSRKPS